MKTANVRPLNHSDFDQLSSSFDCSSLSLSEEKKPPPLASVAKRSYLRHAPAGEFTWNAFMPSGFRCLNYMEKNMSWHDM